MSLAVRDPAVRAVRGHGRQAHRAAARDPPGPLARSAGRAVGWVGGLLAAAYTIGEKTADGGRTIQADSVGHWLQAAAVVIVFGVLAAMPVAIGIDLITRSGRVRPPRRRRRNLIHPIRAARHVAGALRPAERAGLERPPRQPAALALRVPLGAGLARLRAASSRGARGVRRHVRQARADRLDPDRRAARRAHRRALQPPRGRRPVPGVRDPRRGRALARRADRAGVRLLRGRAAGRRFDRPNPPGGAQRRHPGGRQGPASRDRRGRRARRRGAAAGLGAARAPRRDRPRGRAQRLQRGADRRARAGARLPARGVGGDGATREPRRRRRDRDPAGPLDAVDRPRAGDGGGSRRARSPTRDAIEASPVSRPRAGLAAAVVIPRVRCSRTGCSTPTPTPATC